MAEQLSKYGLWTVSTTLGAFGIDALIASFFQPRFGLHAFIMIGTATIISILTQGNNHAR
jgi:hypothetical protein